jgi:UDP-N-acetylmuramyl pentapeptide phosphotransferase/UDP-N-acetylglucosamine-1-phosphate transferase
MNYILPFSSAFIIVYLLIPILKKFSVKCSFVDQPTERKKHNKPIPLLGGAGIFIGFICGYVVFVRPINKEFISIIIASTLVLLIGIVDDWFKTSGKEFPVLPRLIVHILAANIVYSSGIVFYGFTNPLTHQYIVLPVFLQFILSIMWIIGVTTVINWSDGVDGLAGSISAIAGSTLFVVALAKGQNDSALISALIVGAALGFLRYNRHPAQIFMGDSGANFLGFILGVIALDGAFKQATLISISIPVLALGVPIIDNLFIVMKRFFQGDPIYKADASQIHHRLLSSGLNQKQVVTFISLLSLCCSFLSIIILLLKI